MKISKILTAVLFLILVVGLSTPTATAQIALTDPGAKPNQQVDQFLVAPLRRDPGGMNIPFYAFAGVPTIHMETSSIYGYFVVPEYSQYINLTALAASAERNGNGYFSLSIQYAAPGELYNNHQINISPDPIPMLTKQITAFFTTPLYDADPGDLVMIRLNRLGDHPLDTIDHLIYIEGFLVEYH